MLLTSTHEGRTYDLTPVCDKTPEPRWLMIRDVETQRSVLAQRDGAGNLYALDESGNEVDARWLACVLERSRPKEKD